VRTFRPFDPKLVARGKDYLVHYLPASLGFPETAILHTTPSTGDMKALLRLRGDHADVIGYLADRERLYVAVRTRTTDYAPGSGLPFAPVIRYNLHAYWLADGSELAYRELAEADVPEKLRTGKPVEKGGPLELTNGGVRGFGRELSFDGKKTQSKEQK
jgi:hypothetical protein